MTDSMLTKAVGQVVSKDHRPADEVGVDCPSRVALTEADDDRR
jgi:hypothetical protein